MYVVSIPYVGWYSAWNLDGILQLEQNHTAVPSGYAALILFALRNCQTGSFRRKGCKLNNFNSYLQHHLFAVKESISVFYFQNYSLYQQLSAENILPATWTACIWINYLSACPSRSVHGTKSADGNPELMSIHSSYILFMAIPDKFQY